MADKSKIEWCDATANPIRARRKDNGKVGTHCERVSPACKNCYAARQNRRTLPFGTGLDYTVPNRDLVDIFCDDKVLEQVIRWKRGRRIFWNSLTDMFAEFVPDALIDRCFAAMALSPQRTHLVLTKRAKRMHEYIQHITSNPMTRLADDISSAAGYLAGSMKHPPNEYVFAKRLDPDNGGWPLPNVWLGVTAENQQRADERIPWLLKTPAAKRFVSLEPMLGPVDLTAVRYQDEDCECRWNALTAQHWIDNSLSCDAYSDENDGVSRLDHVITGGESGPGARPSHPDWFRGVRDQCAAANVPFLHKQNGEWAPGELVEDDRKYETKVWAGDKWMACSDDWITEEDDGPILYRVGKKRAGRLLDGREHNEFPEASYGRQ